jgi:hypothetical protein
VAAVSNGAANFVICVTDPVCEQLAELQLMLGEGLCHDVPESAAPVLACDLGDEEFSRRWPAFTPAARQLGAQAVFAFPLMAGAVCTGMMALYRRSPGPLPAAAFGDLTILADAATMLLLDGLCGDTGVAADADGAQLDGQAPDLAMRRAEIDQAAGMLSVQLGLTTTEALARLRAYAYSQDRRLAGVTADIVARRLRLDADPSQDSGP